MERASMRQAQSWTGAILAMEPQQLVGCESPPLRYAQLFCRHSASHFD
jgi:hypothetical protein